MKQVDHETVRVKTEQSRIDFLRVETALGHTFADTAALAKSEGHTEHFSQAKQNAVKAVETVRRFLAEVADSAAKTEIEEGLNGLVRRVSAL